MKMPAIPAEIHEAEEEGVKLVLLSGPSRVVAAGGKATGLECVKMALGEPDASGRRRPVPVAGSEFDLPVDMVILCAAMESRDDTADVGRVFGVNQGADGFFLEEHPKLGPLNTATDGVFLAGACQGPKDIPDTVAQASAVAARALEGAMTGRGLQSLASLSLSDIEARAKSLVPAP